MERPRKKYGLKNKIYKKRFTRSVKTYRPKVKSTDSELPVRCEFNIYYVAQNNTSYIYNLSGNSYNNIATELANSYTWGQISSDYLRYKITGLSVRVSTISGVSDMGFGVTNYPIGIGFYPNFASTAISTNEVLAKDDSLRVEPQIAKIQTKYWNFPDKYFESSGTGFGIWTPVTNVTSQVGQLSVGNSTPITSFTSTKALYAVRGCIYIKLSTRKV